METVGPDTVRGYWTSADRPMGSPSAGKHPHLSHLTAIIHSSNLVYVSFQDCLFTFLLSPELGLLSRAWQVMVHMLKRRGV